MGIPANGDEDFTLDADARERLTTSRLLGDPRREEGIPTAPPDIISVIASVACLLARYDGDILAMAIDELGRRLGEGDIPDGRDGGAVDGPSDDTTGANPAAIANTCPALPAKLLAIRRSVSSTCVLVSGRRIIALDCAEGVTGDGG
jgi:hypothetical protein